jgi:hypothetical protein
MRHLAPLTGFVAALSLVAASALAQQAPAASGTSAATPLRWFKGNTHTHTLNSDGDSTPDEVVRWYREHGYHFVFLTDHNFITDVTALQALHGADDRFLVIRGEEVSAQFDKKPLHINGLDPNALVTPKTGTSVVDVLQKNVDAIRQVDGVPHINHPNFQWAITPEELGAVRNNKLFEVYNGHPMVNNLGGGDRPSLEQAWDMLLSKGLLLYGLATDDAHHFKRAWDSTSSRPGQGWVMVRAAKLEARALLEAMERGDFYASTGVTLTDYETTADAVRVTVKKDGWSRYRIEFIGKGGAVLDTATDSPAEYRIRGTEGYVRAKITDSNGHFAWTQPVVVAPR